MIVAAATQAVPTSAAAIVTAAITGATPGPEGIIAIVKAATTAAPNEAASIVTAAINGSNAPTAQQVAAIVSEAGAAAPAAITAIADAAKLAAPAAAVAISAAAAAVQINAAPNPLGSPGSGNNSPAPPAPPVVDPPKTTDAFFDQKGILIGLRGSWAGTRQDLAETLQAALGGPVHLCPAGPEVISKIGVITGGAGSEVVKVAASGVDSFVTGEGPHWSYPLAEELALNVFYGGHYATETSGVKAIAERIANLYSIPWKFHDHPSGL